MSDTYFPAWMLVTLIILSLAQLAERIYCERTLRRLRQQWRNSVDEYRDMLSYAHQRIDHTRRHLSIATKVKVVYAGRLETCAKALQTCHIYKPDAPGGPAIKDFDTELVRKAIHETRIAVAAEHVAIADVQIEKIPKILSNINQFKADAAKV